MIRKDRIASRALSGLLFASASMATAQPYDHRVPAELNAKLSEWKIQLS